MTKTFRIVVEYDGLHLCGWQRQDNGPTAQGAIEQTLHDLFGKEISVAGASRTDAGVHALGQVARFVLDNSIDAKGMVRALNSKLPPEVAIVDCSIVDDPNWHPRFSATGKHYRYQIWTRPYRSALLHGRSWHRGLPLDVAAMQRAATMFVGQHDFAAFRAVGCVAKTTRRFMQSVTVESDSSEPNLLVVNVRGNAFLRNMVRIMVGTLVDIGEDRLGLDAIAKALASGDRTDCGQTAPPQGLTLVSVSYDGVRGEHLASREAEPKS